MQSSSRKLFGGCCNIIQQRTCCSSTMCRDTHHYWTVQGNSRGVISNQRHVIQQEPHLCTSSHQFQNLNVSRIPNLDRPLLLSIGNHLLLLLLLLTAYLNDSCEQQDSHPQDSVLGVSHQQAGLLFCEPTDQRVHRCDISTITTAASDVMLLLMIDCALLRANQGPKGERAEL